MIGTLHPTHLLFLPALRAFASVIHLHLREKNQRGTESVTTPFTMTPVQWVVYSNGSPS